MDIPRIFTISESEHRIHNPFTEEKYATLGRVLRMKPRPNSGPRQRLGRDALHTGPGSWHYGDWNRHEFALHRAGQTPRGRTRRQRTRTFYS